MKCLRCFEGQECDPSFVLVALTALNQLGLLWSERENLEHSKEYLERAEKLYNDFKATKQMPADMTDLYKVCKDNSPTDSLVILEKAHTLTLYYLAQVFTQLKDVIRSTVYFHITLKRQLECKDDDPIEWAVNAATLSQVFMENNGFKQARHHLSAASFILDKYESDLKQVEESDEIRAAKIEILRHRKGDVARCWSKYGLLLLNLSKNRLLECVDEEEMPQLSLDLESLELNSVTKAEISQVYFQLELSEYENQITDQFVLTYDDAKKVFLNVLSWLNQAKEYYTLEDHASDHVCVVQDVSAAYKALIFFEEDEERQCKMYKRRIDCLEPVVKELNPTYYILVCRQMWYELAEIYSDMLEIKCDRMREAVPTAHALKKINNLAENSILNFNKFLESIKEIKDNVVATNLSEELIRPVLVAYFHIGRLYGKIVTPDKRQQLFNAEKSLEAYQSLVKYCEKKETAAAMMKTELGVCQSMAQLLPFKIEKLKRAVGEISSE